MLDSPINCGAGKTQNADEDRTNTNTVAFFKSEPLPSNSFRSFDYARGNESIDIIYFTDLCKPVETYIYARKSTHLQVILQQSTQTQQTCGYRYTTNTGGLF